MHQHSNTIAALTITIFTATVMRTFITLITIFIPNLYNLSSFNCCTSLWFNALFSYIIIILANLPNFFYSNTRCMAILKRWRSVKNKSQCDDLWADRMQATALRNSMSHSAWRRSNIAQDVSVTEDWYVSQLSHVYWSTCLIQSHNMPTERHSLS